MFAVVYYTHLKDRGCIPVMWIYELELAKFNGTLNKTTFFKKSFNKKPRILKAASTVKSVNFSITKMYSDVRKE